MLFAVVVCCLSVGCCCLSLLGDYCCLLLFDVVGCCKCVSRCLSLWFVVAVC